MLDTVRAKRDEIYALAQKHKAERLWVLGSCARKEELPSSDVDFLVTFSSEVTFRDYDALEQDLHANLLGALDVRGEVLRYSFYAGPHRLPRGIDWQITYQAKNDLRRYDSMGEVVTAVGGMTEWNAGSTCRDVEGV